MTITAPVSLSKVHTEFGAPSNTPLSAFVRGGVWVPNIPANAAISTTAVGLRLSQFLGAMNAPPLTVAISNQTITGAREVAPNPTPPPVTIRLYGTAVYRLLASGVAQIGESDNNSPQNVIYTNIGGEWLTGGSASDAEVFFQHIAGFAPSSGILNTWLQLNADRAVTYTSGVNGNSCTVRVYLRNRVSGVQLDTADIVLRTGF